MVALVGGLNTLRQRQSLDIESKIQMTKSRICDWYSHFDGDVYVSYSGGKDSEVLRHIVKSVYEDVPAVFCDTGLEFPEVREIALKNADVVIKPAMTFKAVIEKYGFPIPSKEQAKYIREYRHGGENMKKLRMQGKNGSYRISKKWIPLTTAPFEVSDKCCNVMKKTPFIKYEKETGRKPILGTMACESRSRQLSYINNGGCNAFDLKRPSSQPIGFWTESDIFEYIVKNNIEIPSIYGEITNEDGIYKANGMKQTGCMFCMFGIDLDGKPNRFEMMKEKHPKQWDYCINKLGCGEVLDYVGIEYGQQSTIFEIEGVSND